jgi:(1->4)-alpha-D-glucan 1-alpha-D-glucosylmutase
VRRIVRELPLDLPEEPLRDAVAELLACFPVYRSYLPDGLEHLVAASSSARARRPDLSAAIDALEPVLADPGQPARAALPADERDGDGQGRRGLRLLPLLAAHLPQRGRRRPVGVPR